MKAVIQAGGKGARLRSYTFVLPKPMMPVGDWNLCNLRNLWINDQNALNELDLSR